jgi:multidrug efflux pump subunit AcrA (membrane-fusion protein)
MPNDSENVGDEQERSLSGDLHDASPTHEEYVEQRLHPVRDLPHERDAAQKHYEQEQHDSREAARKERLRREVPQSRNSKPANKGAILFWVALALVVMLVIFLAGFIPRHIQNKKNENAAVQKKDAAPEIEVIEVKRTQQPGELTVPGTTSPIVQAYIYARANGYLKKRYADIGDHVHEGQLLAVIDSPDLDQQVDQARAQLNQAEAQLDQQQSQLDLTKVTWDRYRVLAAKGVFARQDADQKETDYKASIANVGAAQRNIDSYRANLRRAIVLQGYERVTAPFTGVITARNVDVGALINTGGSGLGASMSDSGGSQQIASTNNAGSSGSVNASASPTTGQSQGGLLFAEAKVDRLRILVSVPEGYAGGVKRGQQAEVRVQEFAGKIFHGKVLRTSDSIDQNTRTLLAEVDVDNRDGQMIPGMYTVVSFVQVRGESPLVIPGDAVAVRQDRTMVAVVTNEIVHLRPVEIGRDYGPSVEIVAGLHEGDMVASNVTDDVRDNAKVKTKLQKMPGEDGGSGGAQSNQSPGGSAQYGKESIVDQSTENTTQQGKKGSGGDQQKGSGGKKQ